MGLVKFYSNLACLMPSCFNGQLVCETILELSRFCSGDVNRFSCLLLGHGADVKCVDWHPTKSLVVSGSKDSQQPIKLWDPRTGSALTTL